MIGLRDDGNHQSLAAIDGPADVDVSVLPHAAAIMDGVELGIFAERGAPLQKMVSAPRPREVSPSRSRRARRRGARTEEVTWLCTVRACP